MPDLEGKLVEYLQDTHALEANVLRMLDSMIETTQDQEVVEQLRHHREETERHKESIARRLQAHGADTSTVKDLASVGGAFMKGMADLARSDKPGRNARDAFVTEHLEIASYELLERVAEHAGDGETAEVARRNRADEEAMAQKIAGSWDKFVDMTLREEGLLGARA